VSRAHSGRQTSARPVHDQNPQIVVWVRFRVAGTSRQPGRDASRVAVQAGAGQAGRRLTRKNVVSRAMKASGHASKSVDDAEKSVFLQPDQGCANGLLPACREAMKRSRITSASPDSTSACSTCTA